MTAEHLEALDFGLSLQVGVSCHETGLQELHPGRAAEHGEGWDSVLSLISHSNQLGGCAHALLSAPQSLPGIAHVCIPETLHTSA